MSAVATIGHINLDHVVAVNRPIRPEVTSLVERRYSGSRGRLGGCAANIAVGLVAAGVATEVVSFVGNDPDGQLVFDSLTALGVGTTGIERDPSRRTGTTWLPSVPGGESYCIYDPGGPPPPGLTASQRDSILACEWLVAAVGPPDPCGEALDLRSDDGGLAWAVKADPESVTAELARRLLTQADVIVFNASERGFLEECVGGNWRDATRPGALVVETDGAAGVHCWVGDRTFSVSPAERLHVADSVGAGDAFIAGLLAGLIAGEDAEAAARRGVRAAGALLANRQQALIANRER